MPWIRPSTPKPPRVPLDVIRTLEHPSDGDVVGEWTCERNGDLLGWRHASGTFILPVRETTKELVYDLLEHAHPGSVEPITPWEQFQEALRAAVREGQAKAAAPAQTPCMHTSCSYCHGTGRRANGGACIHAMACPCPKCRPMSLGG